MISAAAPTRTFMLLLVRLSITLAFIGSNRLTALATTTGAAVAAGKVKARPSHHTTLGFIDNLKVVLPELPYAYNALAPHISERTLRIHHGKHHAAYVKTATGMLEGTALKDKDLVTVVRTAFEEKNQGLFNNAGQIFNHDFYWGSMRPNGGGQPTGRLLSLIKESFGDYETFRKEFVKAGMTAFGSGWAWLVYSKQSRGLKVVNSIGAGSPLTDEDQTPLLVADVWEHAYYLDYENMRATYLDTFMDKLVNWQAVQNRLGALVKDDKADL
jgi:superoxide dismutase, Fe-Mn family